MSEVPIEIPEPEQQEDNLEAQRPEWLPDKFKTAEDLAKSYSELESKLGQTTNQLKEQQEQWEQFVQEQDQQAQQLAQQQVYQQQLPQWQEQLSAQYEQDPLGTMALIAQQSAQGALQEYERRSQTERQKAEETAALLAGEIAFRDAAKRYPDWEKYAPAVAEELRDAEVYPEEGFGRAATVGKFIDNAYAKAKMEAIMQATEEERAALLASQNEKVNAQTISGATGRPESPNDDEEFYARLQKAANQGYSAWRGPA